MSNEYNNEIRQMVAYSHMNRFGELDEVYRKAQAFDHLAHTYERYKHSHAHDLKSTMGTKAIDLLKERVEE